MIISGLIKNSLLDYPGFISAVVFVPGCNFDCFYCHNRLLLDGTHKIMDNHNIIEFLKSRQGLLDGVVITGGEPTLQADLLSFIQEIRGIGYKIKLDTNGSSPQTVKQLLDEQACDYYAVDYKAPKAKYSDICGKGISAEPTLETIGLLLSSGVSFEVRTTVYPQLSRNDLLCMSQELPPLPRYVLNRYRKPEHYLPKDTERINRTPYTQDEIEALSHIIRVNQPNTTA
jgi:pyruvate formate lyase activating enzyme